MIQTIRERLHAMNAEKIAQHNRPESLGDGWLGLPESLRYAVLVDIGDDAVELPEMFYGTIPNDNADIAYALDSIGWNTDDLTYREYDALRSVQVDMMPWLYD